MYYNEKENEKRIKMLQALLGERKLDYAFVYYDELNIANGWYLTGWCPQFESGAVFVPQKGEPLLLGGPESEPFARQSSAIKETRNFTAFMVPDEEYPNAVIIGFPDLFKEIEDRLTNKRIGVVGLDKMPYYLHEQISSGFKGIELVDITEEYLQFRHYKSDWEVEQISQSFSICDDAYRAMIAAVKPGVMEIEVAAEGEASCRRAGANGFAYQTIVGSGERSNAVVPTATDKIMADGEMVMLGIAPRINGYAGTFGHTVPVNGTYTDAQRQCLKDMVEVLFDVKAALRIGADGKSIDAAGRKLYIKGGYLKYMVCPFAHTIGLMEAEAPFFGPNSTDVLRENMTVCVDVSFFGHPQLNGLRVETGYVITKDGPKALSPFMESEFQKILREE